MRLRRSLIALGLLACTASCERLQNIQMPEFSMPKVEMPPLLTPPVKEAPADVALRAKGNLKVNEVKPTGPNAINVIFTYVGEKPLDRLTLEAYYGGLSFPAYVTGPILPQAQFLARFKDSRIDVYSMDFTRLEWAVKEAVEREKGYVQNHGGHRFPSRHR